MSEAVADPKKRLRGAFDPTGVPLTGTNLIEAGAGTGKTHAIAGLCVRLLVETALSIREILVVTYTVAATDELKQRIRCRLREAEIAFRTGEGSDPFLAGMIGKVPNPAERIEAAERLNRALCDFDQASIHTIHGFCQRALREHAFESGELFDTELINDDQPIRLEIVENFWRRELHNAPLEFAAYLLEQGLSPESLLRWIGNRVFLPEWRILPETASLTDDRIGRLTGQLRRELSALQSLWPSSRSDVAATLADPALKANLYGGRVPGLLERMDRYVADPDPSAAPFPGFEKFRSDRITAALRKGKTLLLPPLCDLCRRIGDLCSERNAALADRLLFWKRGLIRAMAEELPKEKRRRNIQYFDDLLLWLREALRNPGGEVLARAIRRRYRAALIDEFQDADPVQYDIFSTLFGDGGGILFLIGDPKQAIYSFRGADIFAYLKAASQVDSVYTLDANWRSDPLLTRGVNTLFAHRHHPFVFPEIAFRPAPSGYTALPDRLVIDDGADPPLLCWLVAPETEEEPEKPLLKGLARFRAAQAVAVEIARLLSLGRQGRAMIGTRALRQGDIAILVQTNREARLCRERLADLRIPAVLHSAGDLFDSREAMEIERFLAAVLQPDRGDLVLGALSTDMVGYGLAALEALSRDEAAWEEQRERFRAYQRVSQKSGFLRMFRLFIDLEGVRGRLLAFADGERRLTNCLHLAEVLHREAGERNLGMAALGKWLSEKRRMQPTQNILHPLRLESDAEAVRIVTVHKSKGLQYPVVFCPFLWGGTSRQPEGLLCFHDPVDRRQVCDIGSEDYDAHLEYARREFLAEQMRLFYVALTRARNCCTFVWGKISGAEASAPAYLLHGGTGDPPAAENRYKQLSCREIRADLERVVEEGNGAIGLQQMPAGSETVPPVVPEGVPRLACREFNGAIDRTWRVASFSHLTAGGGWRGERPDRDSDPQTGARDRGYDAAEADPTFAFPRGSRSGTLLHGILEEIDFTRSGEPRTTETIAARLRENGFESRWQGPAEELIRRVVRHPLCPVAPSPDPRGPNDPNSPSNPPAADVAEPIFLSWIGNEARLNEVEFYFPLGRLTREGLGSLFREAAIGDLPSPAGLVESLHRLQFDPVRGFMKGFIDMVFRFDGRYYLVDWKSNFLGDRRSDYHRDRLPAVMADHHYLLQYHLYVIALHRYLLSRDPGYDYRAHFGGVYYLFLRGMNPTWGGDYGVYFDRPDPERIRLLCERMIARGESKWR